MRGSRLVFASLLAFSIAACGATLIRGPGGWHEVWMTYSITPLENGDLLPAGWTLEGFTPTKDGFRRAASASSESLDYDARRADDDAALQLGSEWLEKEDRARQVDVLTDRLIERLVHRPKDGDSEVERFAPAIPRLETSAITRVGWAKRKSTILEGYDFQVDRREALQVGGGEGVEAVLSLSANGGPVERKVYLALIKAPNAEKYLVVAYGNTANRFDNLLPDAMSFAHRVHF